MGTIAAMLDLMVQPMYNAIRGSPLETNNLVAKLHYKVTSSLLVILGFLVTSAVHFGNAISCVQNPEVVPTNVLHTYCWIHSTFTLPNMANIADDMDIYNIKSAAADRSPNPVHHGYYQWVCLVLIMQSIFFYLPRYFWRLYHGRFFAYLLGSDDPNVLTKYFISHKGTHHTIAVYFHFTEFLFLVNLICQIVLTDIFLQGKFIPLGITLFLRPTALTEMFPRLTKCTFHLYGPSGDIQRQDALCLLGQNVFNEKIFIFLWFWYLFLLSLSLLVTVWRLGTLFAKSLRVIRLKVYFNESGQQKMLDTICSNINFSDWFVLTAVSKNLPPMLCRRMYIAIHTEIVRPEKYYTFVAISESSVGATELT